MRNYRDPEPNYEPQDGKPLPICPFCGEETDTFFRDIYGYIVGCDLCLTKLGALEFEQEGKSTHEAI